MKRTSDPRQIQLFRKTAGKNNFVFAKAIMSGLLIALLYCYWASAQQITVSTFAGTGVAGFTDGDALTQAQFQATFGMGVCADNNGNVYVADRDNHAIRKISGGVVTTLAGNGTSGYADGTGSGAFFSFPIDVEADDSGNVFVCDWGNAVIRKITPTGVVTTYAGTPGVTGYQDGPALLAKFFAPLGITIDPSGNVYVSDGSQCIRKIATDGTVSTYAGQFNSFQGGYVDGAAAIARFDRPGGLAFDINGNLLVGEEGNHTIRKITQAGFVSTVAGVGHIGAGPGAGGYADGDALTIAEFNTPSGVVADNAGNIYVADQCNNRIRKIATDGTVTTFAGTGAIGCGNGGYAEGPGDIARFNQPYGICHDGAGNLFVADINNSRIRRISGLISPLTVAFSVIDETCEAAGEGSINLTVTGGIPPYTFLWSNASTTEDISNITAGNYVVIVKDNVGTAIIDTAAINNPPPDPKDPPSCSEIFISEYCEGSFHNKAIELYNPSDDAIALNRYFLRMFMNGAPTPLIQQLVGVLLPKQTFVIAHPNSDAAILAVADQTANKLAFDGDDPVQLVKVLNDITIDIDSIEGLGINPHVIFDTLDLDTIDHVGIPGVDPGNQGYPVGSGSTKNHTLIRKFDVTSGKEDWTCGQRQWMVNGIDDASNLKQHQSTCGIVQHPVELVFSTQGNPIFTARELIVRFDTSAVKRFAVDNMSFAESVQYVDLSFFIKPFAVSAINQKVIGLCDTSAGSIKALKIFRQLKTTDTTTASRLGETIPIPPFWATFVIEFSTGTEIGKVADSLNTLFPLIKYTHPNIIGLLASTADDIEYPNQSSLHPTISYDTAHINVEPAWDFETGKPFVKVGVFDSGIDWDHEDFGDGTASGSKVIDGWNFENNTPLKSTTTADLNGHGTACAGIIGAIRNNNLGIAGIAGGNDTGLTDLSDKGVSLYGLRIFHGQFFGNPLNYVADAIITSSMKEDTAQNYQYGLHIMSNSWRFYESFFPSFADTNITLMIEAVHFANRAKVIFVAARGNEDYLSQAYPAIIDDDWVLCVGGTGTDGEYIHVFNPAPNGSFSASKGWEIDIGAPASELIVITTKSGAGYQSFSGTSAATPHVAGVVGLLMSYLNKPSSDDYDNLAPEDVEAIIQMTAKDNNISTFGMVGVDSLSGYGLLNAGAAMQMVDKEFKRLSHYGTDSLSSYGITKTLFSSNDTITITERYRNDAEVWFLPGKYIVNTYEINAIVSHNLPVLDSIVAYWPRHSSSNLLPLYNSNKVLLPRERIVINSVNQVSASLTGYVYQVKDTLGNLLGWWPFDTTLSQAQLAYSILRHNDLFTGNKDVEHALSWVAIFPNPANQQQTIIINADKPLDLRVSLFDITGRKIKEVFNGKSATGNNVISYDVSRLSEAMYIYEIRLDDKIQHIKFIKH